MIKFKAGDKVWPIEAEDRDLGDVITVLHVGARSYFVRDPDGYEYGRNFENFDRWFTRVPEAWEVGKQYVRDSGGMGTVLVVTAVAENGDALARSRGIDSLWALRADRREMFSELVES